MPNNNNSRKSIDDFRNPAGYLTPSATKKAVMRLNGNGGDPDTKSGEISRISYYSLLNNRDLKKLLPQLTRNTASKDVIQGHIQNLPASTQARATKLFKKMKPTYDEVRTKNEDGTTSKSVERFKY